KCPVRSVRGASNSTGRSEQRTSEAAKPSPHRKRMMGILGVPSQWTLGERGNQRWSSLPRHLGVNPGATVHIGSWRKMGALLLIAPEQKCTKIVQIGPVLLSPISYPVKQSNSSIQLWVFSSKILHHPQVGIGGPTRQCQMFSIRRWSGPCI